MDRSDFCWSEVTFTGQKWHFFFRKDRTVFFSKISGQECRFPYKKKPSTYVIPLTSCRPPSNLFFSRSSIDFPPTDVLLSFPPLSILPRTNLCVFKTFCLRLTENSTYRRPLDVMDYWLPYDEHPRPYNFLFLPTSFWSFRLPRSFTFFCLPSFWGPPIDLLSICFWLHTYNWNFRLPTFF